MIYVLIVSPDYGTTWHYADLKRSQPHAMTRLLELQRQHPDLLYRMEGVSQELFDALFYQERA